MSLKLPPLVDVDAATRARVLVIAAPIVEITRVPLEAMLGRDRTRQASYARHHLMAALWKDGLSIKDIGRVLGRDHTTVMYALRKLVPPDAYQAEVLSRYTGGIGASRGSYRGRTS